MIWFTSDTHFGHKRIIELANRPFKDVTEMNEMLVHNWNSVVHPDDTVYHLGDVALGPIRESLEYIHRLMGRKILITGNHDRNFMLGRRSGGLEPFEWDEEYRQAGFAEVHPNLALWGFHGLSTVNLSHFPYTGDSHDGDRYEEARLEDNGIPLIHGHTHAHGDPVTWSRGRTKKVPLIGDNGKQVREDGKLQWTVTDDPTIQIHVGVDAWDYRPVSQHEVQNLINSHLTA
jgi:calcineurin-like phosphoesterase family protein